MQAGRRWRQRCSISTSVLMNVVPSRPVHSPRHAFIPEVVEVMREIGIDLCAMAPQKLTSELARTASVLITMGCGEACPFVPGLKTLDWSLADPKGQSLDAIRAIRDDIHERVKALIRYECKDCAVNPCR